MKTDGAIKTLTDMMIQSEKDDGSIGILSELLLESEAELHKKTELLSGIETRVSTLEGKIVELANKPVLQPASPAAPSIASLKSNGKGKAKLSITVTGRDNEERISSIQIEV